MRKINASVISLAIITGSLLLTACDSGEQQQQQMPPVAVSVTDANYEQWQDQIQATGTMSAFQGIMIRPEVSGRITKIYFKDGSFIKQGAPVMQIYPDIMEAELERYQAALKLAKLDYERGVELFKKRVISRQDLDTLTSNLQQAEASVAQTQATLEQYNIDAPFDGMLGLRLVDVGTHVSPGQDLVLLQQVDPIRVQFTVPEVFINKLALGQKVQVSHASDKSAQYEGTVYAFDSAIDPSTRTLSIRAKVPNEKRKLIPGSFVEVILFAGQKRDVITVPQPAIVYSPDSSYVYKVQDDKAVKTNVKLGFRRDDVVEVLSGLNEGDVVVTAGQIKLVNNSPVEIKPDSNNGSQANGSSQQQTSSTNQQATTAKKKPVRVNGKESNDADKQNSSDDNAKQSATDPSSTSNTD